MIRSPPSASVGSRRGRGRCRRRRRVPSPTRKRMTGRRPSASRARSIGGREVGAAADVVRRLVGGLLGRAVGGQLLGRAVAVVGLVLAEQPLGGLLVERQPLHLAIRPVRPAGRQAGHLRPLVPLEAQPVQPVEDVALVLDGRARRVRVLEAQHEGAAHVAGEEVVEERGARGADVQRPGRAGRDAAADGHGASPGCVSRC